MTTRQFTVTIVLPRALEAEQLKAMLKRILPGGTIVKVSAQ